MNIFQSLKTYVPKGKEHTRTCVVETDKTISVILSSTEIFTLNKEDKSIILRSGSYRTMVTKRRINSCFNALQIPILITQSKKEWLVFNHVNGNVRLFHEGMELIPTI